jgi:hypothetical protein
VLALQRTAGNRAVTSRLLQRNGGGVQSQRPVPGQWVRSDRSHGPRSPVYADNLDRLNAHISEYIAASHYTNPLHRDLVHHYVWGLGAPFRLTRAQMQQAVRSGSPHLNILGDRRWAQVQQLEEQLAATIQGGAASASSPVSTASSIFCDDDLPSLGEFSVFLEGTLTATKGSELPPAERQAIDARAEENVFRNSLLRRLGSVNNRPIRQLPVEPLEEDAIYFSFTGTMHWFDRWDFDPHIPAAQGEPGAFPQTRTDDAERGVRLAHSQLPGDPFDVTTATVPVTQRPGAPAATY